MTRFHSAPKTTPALALLATLIAGSLTACGGGASDSTATATAAAATSTTASDSTSTDASTTATTAATDTTSTTTTVATASSVDEEIAQSSVEPTFHMAPAMPPEPSTVDVGGTNASARLSPTTFDIDSSAASISTRGLTPQSLAQRLSEARTRSASASTSATASTTKVLTGTVFTPAQIRAAYGMSTLPTVGASLTAAQQAALGSGQTIYIVDAYHDASALSDLNAFSTRFGLPTCTAVAVASTATLPLAKPAASCTLSVVYATSASAMTATAPAYNGGWIPESKLDVQWAHAIAPLARIVLIETPDAMTNNLLGGIGLANKMGAGVVSMSFGLADPGWGPTQDSKFTTTGMTYVAASGDVGAQVQWPAVSANVLAVGGTGMNWSGSGTRYEQAWVKGGGGISAYESLPTYQSGLVPAGGTTLTKRATSDVSFNASPLTGQYVALTLPNATSTVWSAYGGTSISSPQWAGIIAVANAIRVADSKAVLGDVHTLLYKTIGGVPGSYAAAFADVVDGNNGTCAVCTAGTGFDTATGLGTPNVSGLLPLLTGSSTSVAVAVAAPVVPGGSIVGRNAIALAGKSLGVTAPTGVTTSYALSGAPSGLSVSNLGALIWTSPVTGTYSFTATATTSAGGKASNTYSLKIIPNTPLVFSGSASLAATAGVKFTSTVVATDPNTGAMRFTAAGTPSGLTISTAGVLTWAAPVKGTYTFTVTVADDYSLSTARTYTLVVS